MFTKEILQLINKKLIAITMYLVIIGLLFFALAVIIIFYPQVLYWMFIVIIFAVAFISLLMAIKIENIRESINNVLTLIPKKKGGKKK